MTNKRPVNLDIGTIKLPITAYASILHRISGVIMFGVVGILLYVLDGSLASQESYDELKECLSSPVAKLILWACLSALAYHLVAGVRHLIMDLGVGETLEGGKTGAKLVFVIAVILILLMGAWIW